MAKLQKKIKVFDGARSLTNDLNHSTNNFNISHFSLSLSVFRDPKSYD